MDAILFPGRLRPQGKRIASVGSRIEAIKNKKSIKKNVSQSVNLCTVVCIEMSLLCTEVLISSENILKKGTYSFITFQKLFFF